MAKSRGNLSDKVDRDLLHQFLFNKSDRNNMITISPSELADDLGITIFAMSRILKEMKDQGRLRKIGQRLEVVDPQIYMWQATNTTKQ